MTPLCDFHVHTSFCDGRDEPEKMVLSAVEKGVERLGLVVHSYVEFDPLSCVKPERVGDFIGEVARLKKKYAGKIDIFCGIEKDLFSEQDVSCFDYVIGSAHYLKFGDRFKSVDETPEILRTMIDENYGGDFYACAEDYFENLKRLIGMKPDIIGHFDLIKKFSSYVPFDKNNGRYVRAWQSAADALMELDVPFEINFGGMLRGRIDEPYPSPEIIKYLKDRGARLIKSSDAHRCEDIAGMFDKIDI